MKLLVILAAGLRPKDLPHAPRIRALGAGPGGFIVPLRTVFPAVTCTVQATFLTGRLPREHGIVANGWYFRDLAEVWLWRQSNRLVQGEKLYETAARRDPAFTCAKLFWWYNMYAPVRYSVTPRPEYHADGAKRPGLYSEPPELRNRLEARLGEFPLFDFWGPRAGIRSTRWIAASAEFVLATCDPRLMLVYLPHLDYDHQRFGPDDPRSQRAVADLDREAGRLADAARKAGREVVVLSEYGIESVSAPVYPNRILHQAGYLRVHDTSHGQLLDAGASRAFAVTDHQCAHVYVRDPADRAAVRKLLEGVDGVEQVLDPGAQRQWGIDHERSGELVLVSAPGRWLAYQYWIDERRRPDFATTVDIHRKPGFDPAELFVDPKIRHPRLRAARVLVRKKLGFRYLMNVIGTDPSMVRGSHGRLPADPTLGPLFIATSGAKPASGTMAATDVSEFLLGLLA